MKISDIVRKDLKIILNDKKALATLIIMPIILTTILGLAFSSSFIGSSGNRSRYNIVIVKKYDANEDLKRFREIITDGTIGEKLSIEQKNMILNQVQKLDVEEVFFKQFLGSNELKKFIKYRIEDENTAFKLLKDEKVTAVVILPENFIYDLNISLYTSFRNEVNIKVLGNSKYAFSTQIISEVMNGFADMLSTIIIGKNIFIQTAMEEDVGAKVFEDIDKFIGNMIEDMGKIKANINYLRVEGNEPISSFQYYAVGMAVMFILFASGYGSKALLKEKNNVTYQRMIIAGVSRFKIVVGNFFTIFFLALLQMLIMISYSSIILKVEWGSLLLVVIISLCAIFSVASLGTMIAVMTLKAGNYKIANVFQNIIIQFMALVGGSFVPYDLLPEFIQKLDFLSINGMALKSYLKVMMGYPVDEIKGHLFSLMISGIIFLIFAIFILVLKKEEGCVDV
ncbi:hypothetical protein Y919_06555 [Caloranaerobacter azorensis H53214]|uniref:ABC-2 type transporter transmembrane domain-containing protein n=1 Tax=Caloranaerobacter azorensis H53214 TaxID=1156417 RepID=A0A096BHM1_9FIRM|nr:ABC transporter permease [Caloranaerobacter azorensis]KGG80372.1 hypothetical protein Y919_06555 [Caloranaerobacter azorensis H53214]